MLFLLYCVDDPRKPGVRAANRGAHLDYVAVSGNLVRAGGPMLSDDGTTMIGSLVILDAPDQATAEGWSRNDPYAKAGLFERVEIHRWKWLIGAPADLAPKE